MFITLEGPDGAGKTTQAELLTDHLRGHGWEVVLTREPGGTQLGDNLRTLLLTSEHVVSPQAEAYLMTAARAEHVQHVIRPALLAGKTVVCDRFADSTLAYQGGGRGLDESVLWTMQSLALDGCMPDLTILLDLDAQESLNRKPNAADRNRLDDEPLAFHRRVVEWYRRAAQREPNRWEVVDATRSVDQVAQDVLAVAMRHASNGSSGSSLLTTGQDGGR